MTPRVALFEPQEPQSRFTGDATTMMLHCAVSEVPLASTTLEVNVYVPVAVGVPVIAPFAGFSVKPGGSAPDTMENVKDGVPPCTESVDE